MSNQDIQKYDVNYSETGFFYKVAKYSKYLGKSILNKIFILYYVFKDKDTPDWIKAIIIGALGYFILPADLVPDLIPIAGFSDDIATLLGTVTAINSYIKPEHRYQAKFAASDIIND